MTKRRIIGIIIAVAILGMLIALKIIGNRVAAIPENPAGTIGNTAGNLYNRGTFCEYNGVVYFANAYDGNNLYSMSPDQTEVTRLLSGDVSFINAAGNYIYYYTASSSDQAGLGYVRSGRSICRADIRGKNNVLVNKATTDCLMLLGNRLYYTDFEEGDDDGNALITVTSVKIDATESEALFVGHPKLASTDGSMIFYAGVEGDHALYAMNPANGQSSQVVSELSLYLPIVQGDLVYYLDLNDNYHLKTYSLSSGNVTELVAERIDSYNLYGDIIYYQTVDESGDGNYALKRIRTDGSAQEIVAEGVYRDIQITSNYVYFREFNNDVPMYCTPTYGSVSVRTFDAAMRAAMENSK